jgi:5,5'-dehydrodivanillate O-demethylase
MHEDLTLYRGQSGAPHILSFRCAHRGTQLSTGWVEGENLRCRYHGWMYDATGQCVQQPAEVAPFCDRVRIRSYPVQEYLGLVFVYIGEGEPPPLPRYPAMEGEGDLEIALHYRDCNYFANMDNAVDELHHYFVHWQRRTPVGEQIIPRIRVDETAYGMRTTLNQPNDASQEWAWHWLMPNVLQMNTSDLDQSIHWRIPIDDEHHLIPSTTLNPPGANRRGGEGAFGDPVEHSREVAEIGERIRAGRMSLEDVPLSGSYFPIGDDVTQVGQGPIPDWTTERLGSSDVGIILLRNLWRRDLRALAEGRPIKDWRQPEEPLIATPRLYRRADLV